MAHRAAKQDFIACCEGRTPSRMPVLSLGLEFHLRAAGVSQREARLDVDRMVGSQVDAVREYDEDWAFIFPDDYVEFEPLGLNMSDYEDHPTMPTEYLPLARATLNGFRIPDPEREMRLPVHLQMLRSLKARLGDSVLVAGRIAAPFSALALVYGIEALMIGLLAEPDLIRDNIRFFVDHQIAFGRAQLDAGADVLWLGDCCAASSFISEEHFAEFACDAAAAVAAPLTAAGGLLIYHNSETAAPYVKRQITLPVCAVNVGEGVSIARLRQELQPSCCLMGNFDPKLLRDGTPDEIGAAAEAMVCENLPGGRYIFNTGEGVMATTARGNFAAMMQAVHRVAGLGAS